MKTNLAIEIDFAKTSLGFFSAYGRKGPRIDVIVDTPFPAPNKKGSSGAAGAGPLGAFS